MELTEAWFQDVIDRALDDVELVLFEESGTRRQRVLRLYIDRPAGVTHDLCAQVSSVVSEALDEADMLAGEYVLEISSPGLERPLRKRSHFEAQVGNKVYVRTKEPVDGSKVWQGTLVAVGTDDIVVEEHGHAVTIPLGSIANAHLKYEFR